MSKVAYFLYGLDKQKIQESVIINENHIFVVLFFSNCSAQLNPLLGLNWAAQFHEKMGLHWAALIKQSMGTSWAAQTQVLREQPSYNSHIQFE